MPQRKQTKTTAAKKSLPQKKQTPSTTGSINTDVRVELKASLHLGDEKVELSIATDLPFGLDPGLSSELEGNVHSIIHTQIYSPFRLHIRKAITKFNPTLNPTIVDDSEAVDNEEWDTPDDPTSALNE